MGKQRGSEAISTDQTRPAREGKRTKQATVEKQLAKDRTNGGRSPVANEAKQRAAQDVAVPIAAKEDCAAVCRSTLAALERFAKDVEALTVDDGGARRISTFPAAARLNASYQGAVYDIHSGAPGTARDGKNYADW